MAEDTKKKATKVAQSDVFASALKFGAKYKDLFGDNNTDKTMTFLEGGEVTFTEAQTFDPAPEGRFPACLITVANLGCYPAHFPNLGKKKMEATLQNIYGFEFAFLNDRTGEIEKVVSEVNATSGDNGNFYKYVLALVGKPELGKPFSVKSLLGNVAMISVRHSHVDDNTYANIDLVEALPEGVEAPTMEKLEQTSFYFDVRNEDDVNNNFDSLNLKFQYLIKKNSVEGGAIKAMPDDKEMSEEEVVQHTRLQEERKRASRYGGAARSYGR